MSKLKKERERDTLNRFLSCSNINLSIKSIDFERETPDFIIHCDNDSISIELTRFMNKEHKQIEEFRKRIIKKAKEKFENIHNAKLSVSFNFSNEKMSTKDFSEDYFVDLLFNIVSEIFLTNNGRNFHVSTKINKTENKYLHSIHVDSYRAIHPWESIGAFLIKPADLEIVQLIIDGKSELINNYNIQVKEKWLIIEAGLGEESSGYSFNHLRDLITLGGFDKIFFFDNRSLKNIELNSDQQI